MIHARSLRYHLELLASWNAEMSLSEDESLELRAAS